MAGPRNDGTRLDQILAAYGGHRLRVTGYEGDDANLASVRFAVLCGAGHEVRFGQGFSYSGSGWHPVFRVFPAEAGVPSVSTPGQRPPAPPGCPSG
jgi:hypothetical protein